MSTGIIMLLHAKLKKVDILMGFTHAKKKFSVTLLYRKNPIHRTGL